MFMPEYVRLFTTLKPLRRYKFIVWGIFMGFYGLFVRAVGFSFVSAKY